MLVFVSHFFSVCCPLLYYTFALVSAGGGGGTRDAKIGYAASCSTSYVSDDRALVLPTRNASVAPNLHRGSWCGFALGVTLFVVVVVVVVVSTVLDPASRMSRPYQWMKASIIVNVFSIPRLPFLLWRGSLVPFPRQNIFSATRVRILASCAAASSFVFLAIWWGVARYYRWLVFSGQIEEARKSLQFVTPGISELAVAEIQVRGYKHYLHISCTPGIYLIHTFVMYWVHTWFVLFSVHNCFVFYCLYPHLVCVVLCAHLVCIAAQPGV